MKNTSLNRLLWLRFVLVQAAGACLLLAVLTRFAFQGTLINQLIFWLLTVITAINNYYLLAEIRKVAPAGTFGNPTIKRQLAFAGVSGGLSLLGFYQLASTADDFSKVTGLICGLVCGALAVFLIWGVQYVISLSAGRPESEE